jgi:beta-lactamase regulating signal transducer with metallopeptidase domain
MNAFFEDPALSMAAAIVLKASVILGLAAVLDACLRRRASAAARHASWTLALAAVLLLPALSLTLPRWAIAVADPPPVAAMPHAPGAADRVDPAVGPSSLAPGRAEARVAPPLGAEARSAKATTAPLPWPGVLLIVYSIGLAAVVARAAFDRVRLRRLLRDSQDPCDPNWQRLLRECAGAIGLRRPVRLLRSTLSVMPMAAGTRQPAIVIPAIADTWSEDRRRAVLLHELAHVARFDCLTHLLARAACALYWFHPAAWWAANRLRLEREHACDDRVIAAGAPARDYAGHLLEIAYAFGPRQAPALAVSMARPRQLEGRLLAVLDAARNRQVPARGARVAAVALAAVLVVPLAAATTTAVAPERPEAKLQPSSPSADEVQPVQPQTVQPMLTSWHSTAAELWSRARRRVHAAAAAFGLRAQPKGAGTWEVRSSKANDGTVHLRLSEGDSSWGRTVRLDALEGLTAGQLSAGGPVKFTLRRDAGTFAFEGVVRGGVGAGTFSFTPDPAFAEGLAKRGFARPTPSEQYALARADVGYAFLDELSKQGYAKATTAELVRAGEHGVQTEYLREMGALGYRLGTLAPLIELRDHGVGPSYVRALSEQGYKGLTADQLLRARDHGVTPEYVAAMREAGYGSLPMEQLVNARDHGVTPEYVAAMREAGYGSLPMEQLINARDHGVSADYVRAMAAAGYGKIPLDALVRARDHGVSGEYASEMRALGYQVAVEDLVRARDHGVSVEFARELAAQGYKGQPLDVLIRLRDHGVSVGFVKELKSLGYDGLPVDDLIRLRDHGLNAERIRSANARAGTRLPVDVLISMR